MKAVKAAEMKRLEARMSDELGMPSLTLMERAGRGAAHETLLFAATLPRRHARRFVILAGKGGNGGDAYVVARLLAESGMDVSLHSVCPIEHLSGDAATMAKMLPEALKGNIRLELSPDDLHEGDLIVDGLLGSGVSGALREPFKSWIGNVNRSGLPVIALDIPSGLDADKGVFNTDCITADITVCMGLLKEGMLIGDGPGRCGRLKMVDIGLPDSFTAKAESRMDATTRADLRMFFGREHFVTHKNARGAVAIAGGSSLYPGAPALAATAALRSGAGLVFLAMPASARLCASIPNAVISRCVPDKGLGVFCEESISDLESVFSKVDAIAIGPGMYQAKSCAPAVRLAIRSGSPVVIDADALNLAAADPDMLYGLSGNAVLTPHPGEMKRLLEGFQLGSMLEGRRDGQAVALAQRLGVCVVLKGCRSVVAAPDGRFAVNTTGCPALATAGSGDVLSGVCAAFLARGLEPFDAARAAVFVHGLAGEFASMPCSSRGVISDDLERHIPQAMREISPLS